MNFLLTAFCAFLLCSCASDRWSTVGESAASQMRLPFYAEFQHNGKPDTAALFFWRGQWWVYHPEIGSQATVFTDPLTIPKEAVLIVDGATGPILLKPIPADVPWQPLQNGCLPRAIAKCQSQGGGISVQPNHAAYIP